MRRYIFAPLLCSLLALFSCGTERAPISLNAAFAVAAERVDFGEVTAGTQVVYSLDLQNQGQVALRLNLEFEGDEAFAAGERTIFVDVGESSGVSLRFSPEQAGSYSAQLALVDQRDSDHRLLVFLQGWSTAADCDDGNPCTLDRFDAAQATCQHTPHQGSCDDASACTENDSCWQGVCAGTPVDCDDGIDCTDDLCDPEAGCQHVASAAQCDDQDPCTQDFCDLQQGCRSETADNGTPCGAMSCQQMQVCIGGQCLTGPTPDGMPCDDGNVCTEGDRCLAGECQPGPGQGSAISQPQDVDLSRAFGYSETAHPTEVLALHVPIWGGLEIVWANHSIYSSEAASEYHQTRVSADGSVLSSMFLTRALKAKAVYQDDVLYLLHIDEPTFDAAAVEPCGLELSSFGPLGLIQGQCVAIDDPIIDMALTAKDSVVTVVTAVDTSSEPQIHEGQLWVHQFPDDADLLSEVPSSYVLYSWHQPEYSNRPIRNLQVLSAPSGPRVAFEQLKDGACSYCGADSDSCEQQNRHGLVFSNIHGWGLLPEVTDLGHSSFGLGLLPSAQPTALFWRGSAVDTGTAVPCVVRESLSEITAHASGDHTEQLVQDHLPHHDTMTAVYYNDTPAAVFFSLDSLSIVARDSQGAVTSVPVPQPNPYNSQEVRVFSSQVSYTQTPQIVYEATQGGMIAAAITRAPLAMGVPFAATLEDAQPPPPPELGPESIAFFTVGCGVVVPEYREEITP